MVTVISTLTDGELKAIIAPWENKTLNKVMLLLCALRDNSYCLKFTSYNFDCLSRYFDTVPLALYRDSLDSVSALASDEELQMLTHIGTQKGWIVSPGPIAE